MHSAGHEGCGGCPHAAGGAALVLDVLTLFSVVNVSIDKNMFREVYHRVLRLLQFTVWLALLFGVDVSIEKSRFVKHTFTYIIVLTCSLE